MAFRDEVLLSKFRTCLLSKFRTCLLSKFRTGLPSKFSASEWIKPNIFGNLRALEVRFTDEAGSISILIFGLFAILLPLTIGIVDTADAFIAKRELIGIVEPGVQRAAGSIDLQRYYSKTTSGERVPIDCSLAINRAQVEVSQMLLRDKKIELTSARCVNDELVLSVMSEVTPLIDFPIFHNLVKGRILISAEVGASSVYK